MTFKCKIRVSETDADGTIIGDSIEKDADLILDNFGVLLGGIFRPPFMAGINSNVAVIDTGNVARNVYAWSGANYNFWYYTSGYITGVGIGTTSPTRADYKLENQIGTYGNITRAIYVGNGVLQFTGQVLMPSTQNVSEAALLWQGNDTGAAQRTAMMMRDTFTPVSVGANKWANLVYTITT